VCQSQNRLGTLAKWLKAPESPLIKPQDNPKISCQNPLTPNALFCIVNLLISEFLTIVGLSRGRGKIH
jgi:hypothetical protein